MPILSELRRRNVFRVAALYLVAGWVLLQVAELLFGALDVPSWSLRLLLGLLLLGLPLALLPSPLYDTYVEATRLWGLRPLQDQQIGGTLMAVSEAIVFFGLLVYFFVRFMAEEDAEHSHGEGPA